LTGEPRSASVRAVRDSRLLRLGGDTFRETVAHHPELLVAMSRQIAQRLAVLEPMLVRPSPVRTLAIARAGTSGADVGGFAARMERALARLGSTRVVTATMAETVDDVV